jgi:hypothetical protein
MVGGKYTEVLGIGIIGGGPGITRGGGSGMPIPMLTFISAEDGAPDNTIKMDMAPTKISPISIFFMAGLLFVDPYFRIITH